MFVEMGGCLNRTVTQIHKECPYYPDPHSCPVPSGFRIPNRAWAYWGVGYHPANVGLEKILTSVAYLGHWAVQGVIVRYNNHPAIVDTELFMKAFNFLSPVTIEGAPNPDYKPYRQASRPKPESERPALPPLCRGMIVAMIDEEWRNVGANWISSKRQYFYKVHETSALRTYEWSRAADQVDEAVVALLREKLLVTFDPKSWDKTLSSFGEVYDQERKRISKQRDLLEKVMNNLIKSLQTLDEEDMIRGAQQQYRDAKTEHARLSSALEHAEDEKAKFEAVIALKENIGPALENWEQMKRDEQISVLRAFIQRIEATAIDDNGLQLAVLWRDGSRDETLVVRECNGRDWLRSELEQLFQLIESGASQIEISAAFPDRTWDQIRRRYCKERGVGALKVKPKPIKDAETYEMYLERCKAPKPTRAGDGDRWSDEDVQHLLELLDSGATAVELAAAFPTRRWVMLRTKIKRLRGKGIRIEKAGEIGRDETFYDYLARTGQSTDEYDVSVRGITETTNCPTGTHAPAPSRRTGEPGRSPRYDPAGGAPARQWPVRSHPR